MQLYIVRHTSFLMSMFRKIETIAMLHISGH